MRLVARLLLLALSPTLVSCQQQAIAQDGTQDGWEPGGEPADRATADDRLSHMFAPEDWADTDLSAYGDPDRYAVSKAICARHRTDEPPAADWPRLRYIAALEGCDSFALLHGIAGSADPVAARHCALMEREEMGRQLAFNGNASRPTLEGPGLLAMIYANGLGVERNMGVAIHMACEMNGAPFEMHGRAIRLEEMQQKGWRNSDYSPCEDMTSGYGASQCSNYASRLAAAHRDRRLAQVASHWPHDKRAALLAMQDTFASYAEQASLMNNYGAGAGWDLMAQTSGATYANTMFTDRLLAVVASQPVPTLPDPVEGDIADGGVAERAATVSDAEWQVFLQEISPEDRPRYQQHRAATIAARRAFEPKLIAFLRLARPDLTAHQVRALFRDL